MSNSIIEVNNLSKSYTISHEGRERYTALRDVVGPVFLANSHTGSRPTTASACSDP